MALWGRRFVGGGRIPILLLANCLNDNGAALLGGVLTGGGNVGFTIVIGSVNRIGVSTTLVRGNNIMNRGSSSLISLRGKYVYYALGVSLMRRLGRVMSVGHFSCVMVRTDNVYRPTPVTRAVYSVPSLNPRCVGGNVLHLSDVIAMISTLHVGSRFTGNSSLVGPGLSRRSLTSLIVRRVRFYGVVLLGGTTSMRPGRLRRLGRVVHTVRPGTRVFRYGCNSMSLSLVIGARGFS